MSTIDLEEDQFGIPDLEEDKYGHVWDMGWEDSENPHPGFGGSQDIYGGYVSQCAKCGMYFHEFKDQICGVKVR